MILRRLARQLADQSWAAIFIEFVLLVLGVVLGIQVPNWNEARLTREKAESYSAQSSGLRVPSRRRRERALRVCGTQADVIVGRGSAMVQP